MISNCNTGALEKIEINLAKMPLFTAWEMLTGFACCVGHWGCHYNSAVHSCVCGQPLIVQLQHRTLLLLTLIFTAF